MKLEIISFDSAHMALFRFRDDDIQNYGKMQHEIFKDFMEQGLSFTAMFEGRILIVGGVVQTTSKTGYCWTIVSEYAKDHPEAVFHTTRRYLNRMMKDMGLHRVETANIKEAKDHHRWCELLGFKNEGVMRYYDEQGRDYVRFAKYMNLKEGN